MTAKDRLRLVVQFAGRSDHSLEENLATARKEIGRFVADPIVSKHHAAIIPAPTTAADSLSLDEVRAIHVAAGHLILPAVDVRDVGTTWASRVSITSDKAVLLAGGGRFPMVTIRGAMRDVFLEVLIQLLATTSADAIRRCPGCRTVFFRKGRQTHCTTSCYDKNYWKSLPPEQLERYRETQYAAMNWTRGARTSRANKPKSRSKR